MGLSMCDLFLMFCFCCIFYLINEHFSSSQTNLMDSVKFIYFIDPLSIDKKVRKETKLIQNRLLEAIMSMLPKFFLLSHFNTAPTVIFSSEVDQFRPKLNLIPGTDFLIELFS
jgi:hypothetical protein